MEVNQELIRGCIKGERLSQKALYNTCAPYIYTIVKNYISDESYYKDAMQEVFVNIFKSIESFDVKKGIFKGWIARIAVNQCINILKKTGQINFAQGLELVMEIPDEDYRKLEELSKEEIEGLLVNMPNGYKTVFLLNVIEEYSHKEISEMVGISPETSRSQLSRAKLWARRNFQITLNRISYEAH